MSAIETGQKSPHEFVSSTGRPGASLRSDRRVYFNEQTYPTEADKFSSNLGRLLTMPDRQTGEAARTRAVYKGIVSNDILTGVLADQNRKNDLEVLVPLADFGMPGASLAYFGHNADGRSPIVPKETMIEGTSEQVRLTDEEPLARIEATLSKGYKFIDTVKEGQVDSLYELWGKAFGWEKEQVEIFRKNLAQDALTAPSDRTIWFSGIEYEGQIVGATMGQKLDLPGENGNLTCVESTEWSISKDHGKRGIMPAAISMLNAQVLTSLGDNPTPFIFAECNLESFANVVGHKAGLVIPERGENGSQVPQILVQNVSIGDNVEAARPYRDFAFMYMTPKAIETYYNGDARGKMMAYLRQ